MSEEHDEEQGRWYNPLLERFAGPIGFIRSPWVIGAIVTAIVVAAIVVGWRRLGPTVLGKPEFVITLDKIEVSPQPSWIQTDVKAKVYRDGSFDELSLHDRDVVEKIADAFAVHSWVAEVTKVRKFHGKLFVDLRFRRPVAMVEVTSNGEPGLVPVDATGVILPTADFSLNQTRDFLRISIPEVNSYGIDGTIWDDIRVVEAAAIADAWDTNWTKAGLYRVVATESRGGRRSNGETDYELRTREGARVIWGRGLGQERAGEASASQKIAQALDYVTEHGPLDDTPGKMILDVRTGTAKVIAPRTAKRNK